ncbi:hypothetical protein OG806_32365 [Streptomyces sp. NBC_00882]|uniref:hypothetical protein n=1 Tax=Streptomyces sp. NBC_00882 TaxID=2975856 RepID=UPI003870C20D|nr:hypothetical protein OG806_32365 [Streptomyces sp. NBC_00882]
MTKRSFSTRYWNSLLTRNVEKPPGEDLWSRYVAELLDTPLAYRPGNRFAKGEEGDPRPTPEKKGENKRRVSQARPNWMGPALGETFAVIICALFCADITYGQTSDPVLASTAATVTFMLGLGLTLFHTRTRRDQNAESAMLESALTVTVEQIGRLAATHPKEPGDLERLLSRMTQTASALTHPEAKSGLYLMERGDTLRLVATDSTDSSSRFPSAFDIGTEEGNFMHHIALSREIRRIANFTKDPDAYRIKQLSRFGVTWMCPVRAGLETYGLLVVKIPKAAANPASIEGRLKILALSMGAAYAVATARNPEPNAVPKQVRSDVRTSLPQGE